MIRRNNSHVSSTSNSLIHSHYLGIQRRKPSLLKPFPGAYQIRSLSTHDRVSCVTCAIQLFMSIPSKDNLGSFSSSCEWKYCRAIKKRHCVGMIAIGQSPSLKSNSLWHAPLKKFWPIRSKCSPESLSDLLLRWSAYCSLCQKCSQIRTFSHLGQVSRIDEVEKLMELFRLDIFDCNLIG